MVLAAVSGGVILIIIVLLVLGVFIFSDDWDWFD
jgi:hypothetical protein